MNTPIKTKEEIWADHLAKEKAAHSNIEFRNDETILAAMQSYADQVTGEGEDYDLNKLYEWLMDDNRKKAITAFTSSVARNIASEIEFRLSKHYPAPLPSTKGEDAKHGQMMFAEFVGRRGLVYRPGVKSWYSVFVEKEDSITTDQLWKLFFDHHPEVAVGTPADSGNADKIINDLHFDMEMAKSEAKALRETLEEILKVKAAGNTQLDQVLAIQKIRSIASKAINKQ